jgi:hypothetical protein
VLPSSSVGQDDSAGGAQQRATAAVAQRLNHFAADDELQISLAVFVALQDELATPCTVDACASTDGGNALLPDYCCAGCKSFFDRKFEQGDFLWLHTPRQQRDLFLTGCISCSAQHLALAFCFQPSTTHLYCAA